MFVAFMEQDLSSCPFLCVCANNCSQQPIEVEREERKRGKKNVLVGSVSFVNRVMEQDISSCPFLCLCIRNSDYLRPHIFEGGRVDNLKDLYIVQ